MKCLVGGWVAVGFALCGAGSASAGEAEARAAMAKMLPQASIDSFVPAAAAGWYEVVAGGQVLYVSADGEMVMAGDLWNVDDRANLTAVRKDRLRHDVLQAADGERRIVFEASEPRHTVTVFTDFDCGYCQRMHQDIAAYNARGITVEYLLYPRGGLGSASFDKAVSVWCAADREEAFTLAKRGVDPEAKSCPNPIADNYTLAQRLGGLIGTPSVIDEQGRMTGYQSVEQLVARLEKAP